MSHYIGIDLGTTNSAICSFDGVQTHVWKSPEQTDVTPSAIYVSRRGRRFYGRRAYEMAPTDEGNAATLFKRYLGTTMRYAFAATGEELTPEECSAELLRLLFGYLPQEWQDDPETTTVITVPAAFNQMKKDATMQAAELAHIGKVAVMQEPVAAVMSVMKDEPVDGVFVIYDLGGGTFDVSVAEHVAGQVNLLAQGGKEMCGGRDWDRLLWRRVVLPWLREHFSLPDDVERNPGYRRMRQLALFACEQAKIELSRREDAYVQMDETRLAQRDGDGEEIYLDVPIAREQLSALIDDLLSTTVSVTRETIGKAGIRPEDVERIVFIGGPTVYPPLQSRVMDELGIARKGASDPMTAVAEGASIYAESIDWTSDLRHRKEVYHRATQADFDVSFEQRSSEDHARVAIAHRGGEPFSVELFAHADGWTSGRLAFEGRGVVQVPLAERGRNGFTLSLYDGQGRAVELDDDQLVMERVLATVTAIPCSHSIALKALERLGGRAVPVYLVRENEHLPKRGTVTLRAGERLVAGSNKALLFTLWEGEIADPLEDNLYIGTYRIPGTSFSSGVIAAGDEIRCEYEVNESGQLRLGATVPSVRSVFADQNYYSRYEGQLVLEDPSRLLRAAKRQRLRVADLRAVSRSPELAELGERMDAIQEDLLSDDYEVVQQAANDLLDCQRAFARYRKAHLKEARLADLEDYAMASRMYRGELSMAAQGRLDELYDAARRAAEHRDEAFETILLRYRREIYQALSGSDLYMTQQFEIRVSRPDDYTDLERFNELKALGQSYIENGETHKLRGVISRLSTIRKPDEELDTEDMYEDVNVLRG